MQDSSIDDDSGALCRPPWIHGFGSSSQRDFLSQQAVSGKHHDRRVLDTRLKQVPLSSGKATALHAFSRKMGILPASTSRVATTSPIGRLLSIPWTQVAAFSPPRIRYAVQRETSGLPEASFDPNDLFPRGHAVRRRLVCTANWHAQSPSTCHEYAE